MIQGDFLVYIFQGGGVGGLDIEEEKALFWHWIVPIFKKIHLRQDE